MQSFVNFFLNLLLFNILVYKTAKMIFTGKLMKIKPPNDSEV